MTKLELLNAIKHTTDWSYQFSDDHNVWKSGREQAQILANLGIEVEDLEAAKLDTTFFCGINRKEPFMKSVLINNVFYKIKIQYLNQVFIQAYDKNNLMVIIDDALFNDYVRDNIDDTYFNSIFKMLWWSKK
jgi:hypothetical protein